MTRKDQLENIQKLVKDLSEKPRYECAGSKHRIQRLELEVDALKAVINLLLEYAVEAYD